MKILIHIILFLSLCVNAYSQKDLSGNYSTPWGARLTLNPDKTFNYQSFECYHLKTANGKWDQINDTLYLETTNIPGYDSIINIEFTDVNLSGTRVSIKDTNENIAFFLNIKAISHLDTIVKNTDTLGYAHFEFQEIDQIKVGSTVINLKSNRKKNNHIFITFENIDFIGTENFNNQPFFIKGKKLYYVYPSGINKSLFFKRQ